MKQRLIAFSAAAAAALGLAGDTFAASYASGLRNTGGTNYEFILNEASTNVTVSLNGGGTIDLGALGAGRHTFTSANSNFNIAVASTAAAGYNRITDTGLWTSFWRPGGLAINTNPASPYFGTLYVNSNPAAATNTTGAGRTVTSGIYALTADRVGVDLPTRASLQVLGTDPSDLTLAKKPGVTLAPNTSSSMYRIGMDDAGNILASDWTNTTGGIKVFSADLTTGGLLLREAGGPVGGVVSDDSDEFGPLPLHGSIVGTPQATGVWGQNLTLYGMDEDLDVDLAVTGANDGNSVWKWNVGATPFDYAGAPKLEIGVGSLTAPTAAAGKHTDGSAVFLNLNIGVTADAFYNPAFNKWYLTGARTDGNDSSSFVIATPEGPGGDGKDITIDWSSKQFSIDNGLDGYVSTAVTPPASSLDPANDILRNAHSVAFSPDNTIMYVARRIVGADNPILGAASGLGAKILAIPLDENGLPVIGIDDMGTPETTDDRLTGITPIVTAGNQGTQGSQSVVQTDAAGNVYFTSNVSELVEYYSLGGSFVATTGSAGTFSIAAVEVLAGDYNGDGTVDAADYTVWRDNPAANGGDGGYLVWANNYGATSGSSSTAVPEPTSVLLCLAGLAGLATRRSRR